MKTLPKFKNQAQEMAFWEINDVTDFFDIKNAKIARFSNLKKSTKTISLRLPEDLLESIKVKANALDIPYQSLIKVLLKKELTAS